VTLEIVHFDRGHLAGAMALFDEEGWRTYTLDSERTFRALTAPGATSLVALSGGEVAGVVQLQSDGVIQAHLTTIVVAARYRRLGVARELLREALRLAGGLRIDLISYFDPFYEAVASQYYRGFRITRADLGLEDT
jgi:ribosomal protein S18 acetylase RimI-like enzyme